MRHPLCNGAITGWLVLGAAAQASPASIDAALAPLASPWPEQRAGGEQWLREHGDEAVDACLRALTNADAAVRSRAAEQLPLLLSPFAATSRGLWENKGYLSLGVMRRPVARVPGHPRAAAVRAAAATAIEVLVRRRRVPLDAAGRLADADLQADSELRAMLPLFLEVADDVAPAQVAGWLATAEDYEPLVQLLDALAELHGRPRFFEGFGGCGTGPPDALRDMRARAVAGAREARTAALAWHGAHAGEPLSARIAANLSAWEPLFGSGAAGLQVREFRALVRAGESALQAIGPWRAAGASAAQAHGAAMLDAWIGGRLDAERTRRLLAGDLQQQLSAIDEIQAAASGDWLAELGGRAAAAAPLGPAAAAALVRIHRTAARPALQAASARAPDNETAKWALAELAAWGR